jgi:hypothetical protein
MVGVADFLTGVDIDHDSRRDRSLLDGDHLPLHLGQFGGCLLVAADEERRWPKHDDSRCGRPAVLVRWLSRAPVNVAALVEID